MHVERYQWFLMIKFPYFSASRSKASIAFLSSNSSPTFGSPTPTPFQDTKSNTIFVTVRYFHSFVFKMVDASMTSWQNVVVVGCRRRSGGVTSTCARSMKIHTTRRWRATSRLVDVMYVSVTFSNRFHISPTTHLKVI